MDYLLLILGFATLIIGGEFLVKGAVGLAIKANISKPDFLIFKRMIRYSWPILIAGLAFIINETIDKLSIHVKFADESICIGDQSLKNS